MKGNKHKRLPLEGIRVLDLTRLIPGAVCTSILADAGAEVVKVEEPEIGDYARQIHPFIKGISSRFLILNRNKKSMALNLKSESGREVFFRLVGSADVLVEGFRPGTMSKLGIGYESLKKLNRKIIYCSVSSFGQEGPYRDVVAHDINILGMAGVLSITGAKGGFPAIPGVQIADSVAGMNGAIAILLSLFRRNITRGGTQIDISMYDSMISWMFDAAGYVFAGAEVPERGDGRLWGGFPNYNIYETKDGKFISVGALEAKFKRSLLERLGWDKFEEDVGTTISQKTSYDEDLQKFLNQVFLSRTRDEWVEELKELNACIGPVNSVEEALTHPATKFRRMVSEIEDPMIGKYRQLGSALKSSVELTNPNRLLAPMHGQHTRELLTELGYSEEEVNELKKSQIIPD
jgi:crotonobetainyl-CoA:carnitine CoA-transferase CaiB-like acyl-CoA transferase